jgi:predicted amidohydrolase YtcJ
MDEQSKGSITRRDFLRAAGLGLGTLAGAVVACGRGGRQAAPIPSRLPSSQPEAVSVVATTPATPSSTPTAAPSPELAADLVLLGGKVITVDPADSIAEAVAIRNGLIQAVGSTEEIRILAGPDTETIDLGGRALTPGLIDAHNHLQVMGLMHGYYVPFLPPEVKDLADLRAKLTEVVGETPEGEWVKGYFMVVNEGRLPNRYDLDPVSPQHPVWIMQQGGHYGSANSLALQVAGITSATSDPVGGVVEREAGGEPTGVFYNHRAMDLVRLHIPRYTQAEVQENVASVQPLFAAAGVTSFQDNNVRGTDTVNTYLGAGPRGDMQIRGAIYYTLEWPGDVERALNEIAHGFDDEYMRFAGFKFLLDGQPKMAYCHEPHEGVSWNLPTWEPETFKAAVRDLHDTGLQVCVHCVGDAAVDLTLDAFEKAINANPRPDPRHRIEHCVLTTPEASRRMKDLGVVVSTQPQFLRLGGDAYVGLFGEERARRAMVTREWLDAGVPVALGSDAPTTPWYAPQVTLFGAVTRITASGRRHEPDQALTVEEALRAHTMGSAYAAHEDTIKGSIEVGKLADLVVWSEDPYTAPIQRLWEIPVDITFVGSQVVHQRTG